MAQARSGACSRLCRSGASLGLGGEAAELAVRRSPEPARQTNPSKNPSTNSRLARRAFIGGAAALAASVSGLAIVRPPLGLWPSLFELTADYRTRTGERRNIEVAGSVSVELNTRTSIDLRPGSDGIEAIELLAGEAIIAKQSDPTRAFAVLAGDGRATATRASFNIRKDGDTVCVTCIQGDVRIQHRQGIATLREQQQVAYDFSRSRPGRYHRRQNRHSLATRSSHFPGRAARSRHR